MHTPLERFALARRTGIGALAGAGAGIVAGLGARIVMRIVADAIGQFAVLTVEGTLAVLVTGVMFGFALGAPYGAVKGRLPGPAPAKGLIYGLVLLVLVGLPLLLPPAQGELARAPELLGKSLFGFLILVYGLSIALCDAVLERALPSRTGVVATVSYSLLSIVAAAGLVFFSVQIVRTVLGIAE
jgi:hypothetical protein